MKDIDKLSILDIGLPSYLRKDIEAFEKGEKNNCTHLDCLHAEVLGSINAAYWDNEISEEQYHYLWSIYY